MQVAAATTPASNLSDTSSTEELGTISLPTSQVDVKAEEFDEDINDINRKLLDMFDQVAEANKISHKNPAQAAKIVLKDRSRIDKEITEAAGDLQRTPPAPQTSCEKRGEEKATSKPNLSGNSSMISPTCVSELDEAHTGKSVESCKERLCRVSTSDVAETECLVDSRDAAENPVLMEGAAHLYDSSDLSSNKTGMEGTVVPTARRQNAKLTSQGDAPERPAASRGLVSAAKSPSCPSVVQHPAMSRLQDFVLHEDLQLQLSQPTVNRVSFYGVIHDINKEAASMAAEDHSAFHKLSADTDGQKQSDRSAGANTADSALIDEEEWLLSAIASRSREETLLLEKKSESAASFAYAVGDAPDDANPHDCPSDQTGGKSSEHGEHGDKPNPIGEINGSSRTRLWKPSRSWWEARSGKNPWIDPESHVKRWRYLWPLIHYHKFLARCIKKLKRHGVTDFLGPDSSPVISFLRHEIISISDHLACCSNFTSEGWLAALQYFCGWHQTSPEAQECLSVLVARQKLRSFADPTDTKSSPLLRKVLSNSNTFAPHAKTDGLNRSNYGGRNPARGASWNRPMPPAMAHGVYAYPVPHSNYYYQQQMMMQNYYGGLQGEVVAPRQARNKHTKSGGTKGVPPSMRGYRGKSKQYSDNSMAGPTYHVSSTGYHGYAGQFNYHMSQPMQMPMHQTAHEAYYTGQVHQQPVASSVYHPAGVVSSGPSSPMEYGSGYVLHGSHLPAHHNGHHVIHEHQEVCSQQAYYPVSESNVVGGEGEVSYPEEEHDSKLAGAYAADSASGYAENGEASATPPSFCSPPQLPSRATEFQCTVPCVSGSPSPVQHLRNDNSVPPSPYWGHLDQVALAVTLGCDASFVMEGGSCGRTTPAKSRQNTPKRASSKRRHKRHGGKPLLLNPFAAQQHYRPVHGGMVLQPPSPATQFLMSPQANSEAAAFYTVPDALYEQHCTMPSSDLQQGLVTGVVSPSMGHPINVNGSVSETDGVEESVGLATPRDLRSELASHVESEAEVTEITDATNSDMTT